MRILASFLGLVSCAFSIPAKEVTITVLVTTDIHGNIYPYDYLTGRPSERGLAKLATLIAEQRKVDPDALLIDCGDTIQGAPLESVYQHFARTGKLPLDRKAPLTGLLADPMMTAMNYLRYDAMAVGNHEFNFGLANLDKARSDANFPWLSANITAGRPSARRPFDPYLVKTVHGVRVGIIGVTTPSIPAWEKPENYEGYGFAEAVESVRAAADDARKKAKADILLLAAHTGLDRDLRTGTVRHGEVPGENVVYQIATQVPAIDAIVFGHTHSELASARIGNVLLMQPKNWGMSLGRLEFGLEPQPGGGFRVTRKHSKLLPVSSAGLPDAQVLRLAAPYHEATETYLKTVVSETPVRLDARRSRIEDSAVIDAVHQVQLHYAKADVSFTSAFNPRLVVPQGAVTIRNIAALYVYDNELYAIEGDGKMVKAALENAARYYQTCPDRSCTTGPLINKEVIGFNYDMAEGVTYDVDLTKPEGQRIQNLRFKGEPLASDRKLRIAVNNYRAGGSGGYIMFKNAKLLWRSYEDIRDLIITYYSARQLPSKPNNNWKITPEGAHGVLARETSAETTESATK